MKKTTRLLAAPLAVLMTFALLSGCAPIGGEPGTTEPKDDAEVLATPAESTGEVFSYSDGIDENGYWAGLRALDYVEMFDYGALPIPAEVHAVSEEALQGEIDYILSSYSSEIEIYDRAVQDGDTVNIDYVGSVDGVEFSGGSTGGAGTSVTIGVTSYIDDFLEQLIGHMPGDTFDVNVTFPEDYGVEDLNGRDAVFVTTVNYISEPAEAELTDEFVDSNFGAYYGWTTVEELCDAINENLSGSAVGAYVQDYLLNSVNVSEIPQDMLVYQENSLYKTYEDDAEHYGMEIGEFLMSYAGVSTREELISSNEESNREAARFYLVVQAVAEDMGLVVSDEDVANYFMEYFYSSDYSEYELDYGMPYLKFSVMCQMVIDYIVENAVLL